MIVVSIIALLISIAVPSLSKARIQAKRTACAARLHQIGVALITYMQETRDRLPHVSYMPSLGPAPLTTPNPVYIADVLAPQLKGEDKVFQCPEDRPNRTDRPAPNTGLSYFETERSSYEFRIFLSGYTPIEFASRRFRGGPSQSSTPPNKIWVMRDYANFHGKSGKSGARRYLYIDGHVTDYEN
jgi:type II secretory pathway pseudopilin PulG